MNNPIQFPPNTVSSKLSSKLLKKPPSPIDWVHQSYMEMIQDVSYTTSHYYESNENGSGILEASVPELARKQQPDETHYLNSSSSTDQQYKRAAHSITPPLSLQRLFDSKSTSPPPCSADHQKSRLKQVQEEEEDLSFTDGEDDDDDDDDDEFNTITTSSTDCNRKNNIYRFYREQKSLARPIDELDDEDPAIYKVMTPHSSNYGSGFASDHSQSSIQITPSSSPPPPQQIKLVNQQQQQQIPKKKLKIIGKLITKMRIAAEKPFWSIDNHF
ncbi:uncharacterized protein ATC70_008166 [Mucor velutinosus]|uniref:Uncharacterized protein n=1 Tax=Mucor velutinosus TaxID=708070 RepID=A0AAN7DMU9_9FUNG|nr:hypothetical protein ATC70_008166 [Mucor velutinosus]